MVALRGEEPLAADGVAMGWSARLLALLFYGALTAALFWNVLARAAVGIAQGLGDPPSQAWIIAWGVRALFTHPADLWNAPIFYPASNTFTYQDTLLGLLPITAPLLLATHNLLLVYNIAFLCGFGLSAWAMFLFVERLLARLPVPLASRWWAALAAGVVYGFSPLRLSHLAHLNVLSIEYIPLCFLAWEVARGHAVRRAQGQRGEGWRQVLPWAALAVCGALQALCSLYNGTFLAMGLGLLWLADLWERRLGRRVALRMLPPALAAGLAAGLLLAPMLGHYLRLVRELGGSRPLGELIVLSPDLRDFLHTSPLSLLYGWTDRLFPAQPLPIPRYFFVGITVLALAALAVWGRRWAWLGGAAGLIARARHPALALPQRYGWLTLAALLLALGPVLHVATHFVFAVPLPYMIIYTLVPPLRGLRDTGRLDSIAGLGWGVLVAIAVLYLLARLAHHPRAVPTVGVAVLLALLVEFWIAPIPLPTLPLSAVQAPYHWLAAHPDGRPLLELPFTDPNKAVVVREQALAMYGETLHHHPIVNGVGGFVPPHYASDSATLATFPSAPARALLARWHVGYVLLRGDHLPAARGAAVQRAVATLPPAAGVRRVGVWGTVVLYAIFPAG